jgi:hypothetical protein
VTRPARRSSRRRRWGCSRRNCPRSLSSIPAEPRSGESRDPGFLWRPWVQGLATLTRDGTEVCSERVMAGSSPGSAGIKVLPL